jgi:hypothetical protein
VTALYAIYTNVDIRPDRAALLAALTHSAHEQCASRVTRNIVTTLCAGRRIQRPI